MWLSNNRVEKENAPKKNIGVRGELRTMGKYFNRTERLVNPKIQSTSVVLAVVAMYAWRDMFVLLIVKRFDERLKRDS